MDEKQIPIFDEIFGTLDNVFEDDTSGLEVISRILVMDDEQFDVIKGTLMDSIAATFNSPDARIAFAQMVNQQGVRIEDLRGNIDDIVAAIGQMAAEGVELNESKKDFGGRENIVLSHVPNNFFLKGFKLGTFLNLFLMYS